VCVCVLQTDAWLRDVIIPHLDLEDEDQMQVLALNVRESIRIAANVRATGSRKRAASDNDHMLLPVCSFLFICNH